MTTVAMQDPAIPSTRSNSRRAEALADRLEQGARALAAFAAGLTDVQWRTRVSATDARTAGIVVHHVASMYPVEIHLAQTVAVGTPVTGMTMDDVNAMNAAHAKENVPVTQGAALELLARNSAAAAAAIRALSDDELDRAVPVSLYEGAPLTCQFVLEDHAVRHSYHHLAFLRNSLKA
jgi:uncharacterized protein DUF664